MVDFSIESLQQNIRALFVHGALFHCESHGFEDGSSRDKFLLVMRGRKEDAQCYYYLPTSKVTRLQANVLYRNALYIFPLGSVSNFTVETAININDHKKCNFQKFESRYVSPPKDRKLDFLCNIGDDRMAAICRLIKASPKISSFDKGQMIPPISN